MQNKKMKTKVYIASPYILPDPCVNTHIAMNVANELLNEGYLPFCPHLFHYQNIYYPRPEKDWLEIDKEWLKVCDVVLRIEGYSSGADAEVALAKKLGIPVVRTMKELEAYKEDTLSRTKISYNQNKNKVDKRVVNKK